MKKKDYINVFEQTNLVFDRCFICSFLSNFVVWAIVFILMLFPVFGLGLSFYAMCFLCVGYKKNNLDCINKKTIKIEIVFEYFKNIISCFCLKASQLFITFVWSLLFIIPGLVTALNYSFASYILCENPEMGTIMCLEKSKQLTYGKRAEMFVMYLLEFLLFVLIMVIISSFVILLNYYVSLPSWVNILVPLIISLFFFVAFVVPYFEMAFANMYVNAKIANQKSLKQKSVKSVSNV